VALNLEVKVKQVDYKKIFGDAAKKEEAANLESAIKKFRNKIKKIGLMNEIYNRMYFEKPSTKKRRLKKATMLKNKYNNMDI